MIKSISFNEETKSFNFSFKDTWNKVKGWGIKNERPLVTGASALVGGLAGRAMAKRKAENAALKAGLKPGTPEYQAAVRKGSIKGAALGALGGAAISEGAHGFLNKGGGWKPYQNLWNKTKGLFKKSDKK
jgi:hypothetical protein